MSLVCEKNNQKCESFITERLHRPTFLPDVPVGAHGLPLAVTPEIEIADSGGGFVHVRKGIGQDANVVVEGDLHVEDMIVIDGAHYIHHFRESSLPMRRGKKNLPNNLGPQRNELKVANSL